MNKLSGVAGFGIGVALGSGFFFSPAEAQEIKTEPVPEAVKSSCFSRLGQYAIIGLPGPLCFGQPGGSSQSREVMVGPADSNKRFEDAEIGTDTSDYRDELLFLAGGLAVVTVIAVSIRHDHLRAAQDPNIARDYEEMKHAKLVEFDAEWIIYDASHPKKQ